MENNSSRHGKKAHISQPRSILIDKEIRGARDSRPISAAACTNRRTSERTDRQTDERTHIYRRNARKRARGSAQVSRAVKGDRKRSFRETDRIYFYVAAPRFPAAAILSNDARRGVTDPDSARSPDCSRETWNRCTARVDIDSSVSVFGATHKKKRKKTNLALLTLVRRYRPVVRADARLLASTPPPPPPVALRPPRGIPPSRSPSRRRTRAGRRFAGIPDARSIAMSRDSSLSPLRAR